MTMDVSAASTDIIDDAQGAGSNWLDVALEGLATAQPDADDSQKPQRTMSMSMSLSASTPEHPAASHVTKADVQRKEKDLICQAKECPPITLGLLNRAMVCSHLAAYAYKHKELKAEATSKIQQPMQRAKSMILPQAELATKSFKVKLDDSIPHTCQVSFIGWHPSSYQSSDEILNKLRADHVTVKDVPADRAIRYLQDHSEEMKKYIQWAVWYVEDLGYVTAFRGSIDAADWMANCLITTRPLDHAADITVHQGIYTRVKEAWQGAPSSPGILQIIQADAATRCGKGAPVPVLFTGNNLAMS